MKVSRDRVYKTTGSDKDIVSRVSSACFRSMDNFTPFS